MYAMSQMEVSGPGILTRMVLKNTPLPSLIRQFLMYQGGDSFRFLEDFQFPGEFSDHLQQEGVLGPDLSFFLKDRSPYRAAVVIEKGKEAGNDPGMMDRTMELSRSLSIWMDAAGKRKENYRMIPFYKLNFQKEAFPDATPYMLILWRAEKSFLEHLLSGKDRQELPGNSYVENDSSHTGVSEANLEETSASLENQSDRDPGETWKRVRYRVAGNRANRWKRKMYLLRGEQKMRVSLLVSREELSEHYILSFFDRMRSASDSVSSHAELLRMTRLSGEIGSFTCEIGADGQLSFTGFGIPVLLFRNTRNRIKKIGRCTHTIEDRQSKEQKTVVHQTTARIVPGDVLFLLTDELDKEQTEILEQICREKKDPERTAFISDFLDSGGIGKTLILTLDEK